MTNNKKTELVKQLIYIASIALEDDTQLSLFIYDSLSEITPNNKIRDMLKDMKQQIDAYALKTDISKIKTPDIPKQYSTDDIKIYHIATNTIIQLFNTGQTDLAFETLMFFAEEETNIYISVVNAINRMFTEEQKEVLKEWASLRMLFVQDVLGSDELKAIGYTITKNDNS